MKTTKRIFAIIACICMLAAMVAIPASAAADGTITITAADGSNAVIGGKKFNIFKIFEATKGTTTAYEWNQDLNDESGKNAYYDFFFGDASGKYAVITKKDSAKTSGSIVDVVDYILSLKDNSFEFSNMASLLHDYVHDKGIDPTDTLDLTLDTGATEAVFDGLEYGYYLIYDSSTLGAEEVRSAAMLTNVTPDAEVTLKAYRPTVEKYVDDDKTDEEVWKKGTTSAIGERDTFKIVTAVPNHDLYGDFYKLTISDKMDDHLQLDTASVKVSITENGVKRDMVKDTEYTLEFPTAGEIDLAVDFKTIPALAVGSVIEIYYDTILLETVEQLHTNEVTMTFSNDPGNNDPTDPDFSTAVATDSAMVRSYYFVFTKRAETAEGLPTSTALAGAEFKVYNYGSDAPIIFRKVEHTLDGKTFTVYVYAAGKTAADLAGEDTLTDTVKTTDTGVGVSLGTKSFGGNLGEITLVGLSEGKYTLKETKAPDGYQQALGDFLFGFTDTVGMQGNVLEILTEKSDAIPTGGQLTAPNKYLDDLLIESSITNRPGETLPGTGGMGTTLFTVGGIVLMAGAIAFFTLRKRNNIA